MRILLLEDDKQLGPWIEQGLTQEGHVLDLFVDGKDALVAATVQEYDVFIFDRMVPGLDGVSLLRALRAAKNQTPTLFLTALGEVDDRIDGFNAGGDDYLVKPFAFVELSARVQALGRRASTAAEPDHRSKLTFSDLCLDLEKRRVLRQGLYLDLNTKEFQILEYFMRRPGRVVTKTMLLEQVWNMSFDPTTGVVETHISRLRAKLDKPFETELIVTRRGMGYVFGS